MLKTEEYLKIETKWKKYKQKQLYKVSLIILFIVFIIALLFAIFSLIFSKKNNDILVTANLTNNSSAIVTSIEENNKTTDQINTSVTTQTVSNLSESDVVTVDKKIAEVKVPKKIVTTKTYPTSTQPKKELNSDIKPPVSKNTLTDNKPLSQNNIIIEANEISNIDSLINRFNSTRNIVIAIMISEEFYDKKDYENSLKWALTANDIDSKNEKSWIMFAKSKAKLGKDDEAMHALQVFLKHSPNANSAKSLLESIKNGTFK